MRQKRLMNRLPLPSKPIRSALLAISLNRGVAIKSTRHYPFRTRPSADGLVTAQNFAKGCCAHRKGASLGSP